MRSTLEQNQLWPTRRLQNLPRLLLAPLPLFPLQPLLKRIVTHVARSRPELFTRLGPHAGKRFLIDPENLPFALLLQPHPERPDLSAHRRYSLPAHDAGISGSFFNLLDMIDGSLDGDALFFARDLHVYGDTEAVVALRNALDDLDEGVLDTIAGAFGPLSQPVMLALQVMRTIRARNDHEQRRLSAP